MAAIVLEKPCLIPYLKITNEIDSARLEAAFRSGRESKAIAFELNWFEKILACFKGDEKSKAARLMYHFGKAVRNFDLPDNLEIHRDKFKIDAFKLAGELRMLVNNDTLDNFDALINQKLKHMMTQGNGGSDNPNQVESQPEVHGNSDVIDENQFGGLTQACERGTDSAPDSLTYTFAGASISNEDAVELFGAFYAEPKLDSFSGRIGKTADPVVPIPVTPVSTSKPQSAAIQDVPFSNVSRLAGTNSIEDQVKHLFHATAEKFGQLVDNLGEQANGVFGIHVDSAKSTARVDIAIEIVAVDDAPYGFTSQSIPGPRPTPVDQTKEGPSYSDQATEPENPFVLAHQDEIEANRRYEEHVREVEKQLLAAKQREEVQTQPAVDTTGDTAIESAVKKDEVPGGQVSNTSISESVIPPQIQGTVPPEKDNVLTVIQHRVAQFAQEIIDELEEGNQLEGIPRKQSAGSSVASRPSIVLHPESAGEQSVLQEFGQHVKQKAQGTVHEFVEVAEVLGETAVQAWRGTSDVREKAKRTVISGGKALTSASKNAWHKAGEAVSAKIRQIKLPSNDKSQDQ